MSPAESFTIREATLADVPALASLHVDTFNETHGNSPSIDVRLAQWKNLFATNNGSWFCLVIENNQGTLIGFAKGQPYNHSDLPDYTGELNKIYLLKKYHKQGLGRKLLRTVIDKFLSRNITSMLLFGDANNPTNVFYEAMGAERLYAKNGEFHGGYGWRLITKIE